jgi:pimeloyl-ACP methyl ester carboxylesterase
VVHRARRALEAAGSRAGAAPPGDHHRRPHSTKPIEDAIGWSLETGPEVLIATVLAPPWAPSPADLVAQIEAIRCPVLLIHGTDDAIVPSSRCEQIAEAIVEEISRPVDYLPVPADGAASAAALIADLL